MLNLFLKRSHETDYEDGPVSDIYVPIFDGVKGNSSVAGILSAYLWWQGWFTELLPVGKL